MPTQAVEPEAPEVEATVASPLREIVTKMVAMRDQLEAEEKDFFEKFQTAKSEREKIDKMISASGTVKKPKATKEPSNKAADLFAPREMPTNSRSIEAITKIIAHIETYGGDQFQIGMIEKGTGCNRTTIARALGVMRGEDRLRVLGRRPPMERGSYPGGSQAITFKEIVS